MSDLNKVTDVLDHLKDIQKILAEIKACATKLLSDDKDGDKNATNC